MSYTLTINEHNNPINCDVSHPDDRLVVGSILKLESINDSLLSKLPAVEKNKYKTGDVILLLTLDFDGSAGSTQSTTFNLKRRVDTNGAHLFVVVYNNKKGIKEAKKGKRTANKVSDEMG